MAENDDNNLQLKTFEEIYPAYDRRNKGYVIQGFVKDKKTNKHLQCKKTLINPHGLVPIWRKVNWDIGKKYTGEKLRELRVKRLKHALESNNI